MNEGDGSPIQASAATAGEIAALEAERDRLRAEVGDLRAELGSGPGGTGRPVEAS